MKKFGLILVIFLLILSTAIIKNSAKEIEDEIFTLKENLRILNSEFEKIKLEHDYLSSADKLVNFKRLYFDDELVKKDIQNLKMIFKVSDDLEIKNFKFINE